jgi:hypothetical protein
MQDVCSRYVACQNKTEREKMSKLWKIVILCASCLCFLSADAALAEFDGLVHVTKADPDTVEQCNEGLGLDVCNVLVQFTNPTDRLLSVSIEPEVPDPPTPADIPIVTSDPLGYFQHEFGTGNISPACNLLGVFPDLICDSFVTIGVKCSDGDDGTSPDPDFDSDGFNNDGQITIGGWFNANPPNGQGDAGQDPPNQNLQVLFLQLSVTPGESISGSITVFWKDFDTGEIIAENNQCINCFEACEGCPPEGCNDDNPCTDDVCEKDKCVFTPNDGNSCDDGEFCNGTETCTDGTCNSSGNPCKGGDECNAECNEGAENCFDDDGAPCGDQGDDCLVDDTCDGAGGCTDNGNQPDGTPCNDGADVCLDGECVPAGECEKGDPCDDGNPCTDDECVDMECVNTPNDANSCDDGVFCNGAETCNAGQCDPGVAPCAGGAECNTQCNEGAENCFNDDGAPCGDQGVACLVDDTCDGAGGCTDNGNQADDTPCGDDTSSDCDAADSCQGGTCQDNNAPEGDPCGDQDIECLENDTCDGAGACTDNGNQADDTPCGDDTSAECDAADSCLGGVCQDNNADPGAPCGDQDIECLVNDTCDGAGACTDNGHQADDTPCGDDTSSECDAADSCLGGVCQDNIADIGAPCGDQGVECLVDDTCDGAGGCTDNGNQDNGTPCDDGAGACEDGVCVPVGPCPEGDPCDDGNDCTGDGTCDADGNCAEGKPLADGTPCGEDNSSECDAADTCQDGTCQDNNAPEGDPCGDQGEECLVDDTCDGAGGCTDNGNQPKGTECNDDDNCTTDDACTGGGVCQGVDLCEPGEVCVDGDCVEIGELELPLDIKPRMCPNTVMRNTNAAVWAALLGTDDFDITQVRMSSLLLSRADGEGGSLVPKNTKFKDEGTPFEGDLCDCHADGRDQKPDVRMKFKTDAMVEAFLLNDEPSGSSIELIVTGQLNDGTVIFGRDCILLVR